MKIFPILLLAILAISACQSTPKEKETAQVQTPPKETIQKPKALTPSPPATPKNKWVGKTSTGKAYVVERKEKDGKVEYVLNGEGFKFAKETKLLNHADVKDILTADLDKDGFDEAYIIYDCQEKGEASPVIAAFVSFKDRAFGPIYVRAASAKQLKGYQGHDKIYIENGQLVREFPIFDGEKNTGKTQRLTYRLSAGEAGFVLKPVLLT